MLKLFAPLAILLCSALATNNVSAQTGNKSNTKPEEIWREFLQTQQSLEDAGLFTVNMVDESSRMIEPYRSWTMYYLLSKNLTTFELSKLFSFGKLKGDILELAWNVAEKKADRDLFVDIFAWGPKEVREKAFNALMPMLDSLTLQNFAYLLAPPNQKVSVEGKYLQFFEAKLFERMFSNDDLFLFLRDAYDNELIFERVAQELLVRRLTNSELLYLGLNGKIPETYSNQALSMLLANDPNKIKKELYHLANSEVEPYNTIAHDILMSLGLDSDKKDKDYDKFMQLLEIIRGENF